MKARDKGRYFNLLQYYLHRYLRLIPVFATVMLLVLAFGKYSGNGPRWDTWSEAPMHENCRQYWWSAILMIQNYVNPTKMVSMIETYAQMTHTHLDPRSIDTRSHSHTLCKSGSFLNFSVSTSHLVHIY